MAGRASVSTVFFVPERHGADRGNSPQNALVDRYFPATRAWERGVFYTNGLNAPYYIARARNERAVVIGCSGLNTHYILNPPEVRRMNDAGVSVAWMALPKVPPTMPIMDNYIDLARDFFTDRLSPAHFLMNSPVPRFALTHSTGGQIFFHLLHENKTRKKLAGIFSAAVHVTPYFDTSHASRDHAPKWVQTLFNAYMSRKPGLAPNDRLIAGGYIKLNDWLEGGRKDHPGLDSTCGQILELQKRGRSLTARFNSEAAGAIPSIFLIGDRDNFACPKTAIDIAHRIGAKVEIAKGAFHDPLDSHPQLLGTFIGRIDECVSARDARRCQPYEIPARQLETLPARHLGALGDRAGLALQCGAGLLNASAGLLQRFG